MKSDYLHVAHPDFEVHNFSSLMERVGYHATQLQQMYGYGKFQLLATNFTSSKNMFAISKMEIKRLQEMRALGRGKVNRTRADYSHGLTR